MNAYAAALQRIARRAAFAKGITKAEFGRQSPKVSGSVSREARFMSAAPRANKGAYKTSGYATLPGMRYDRGSRKNVERMPCPDDCPLHDHDASTRR